MAIHGEAYGTDLEATEWDTWFPRSRLSRAHCSCSVPQYWCYNLMYFTCRLTANKLTFLYNRTLENFLRWFLPSIYWVELEDFKRKFKSPRALRRHFYTTLKKLQVTPNQVLMFVFWKCSVRYQTSSVQIPLKAALEHQFLRSLCPCLRFPASHPSKFRFNPP